MRYYAVVYSSDYLAHHGILGQKWGKKNGPPYPLDAEDHSSSEKKAGWRASLKSKVTSKVNKVKQTSKNVKDKIARKTLESSLIGTAKNKVYNPLKAKWDELDEEDKRRIKAGVVLAGTALVAYGAYRVYKGKNAIQFVKPDSESLKNLSINDALDKLGPFKHIPGVKESFESQFDMMRDNYKQLADLKITDQSQIKHWDSKPSIDDLSQSINPALTSKLKGRDIEKLSFKEKIDLLTDSDLQGHTMNCMYCTTAYDLNRRGFKVRANGRTNGGTIDQIADMYKLKDDVMTFDSKYGNVNTYLKKFSSMEEGSRGNMIVSWKGGGGHSMAWEVVDHKLNVIDCQSGKRYSSPKEVKKLISKVTGKIETVRTDNAEIIWSDMMLRSLDQMD